MPQNIKSFTSKFIADLVGGKVIGNPSVEISELSSLEEANQNSISFLSHPKYEKYLSSSAASVILIDKEINLETDKTLILCKDAYLAYALVSELFSENISYEIKDYPNTPNSSGIYIHQTASIGSNVTVGPNTFIGANCKIDDNTIIHPNTTILRDVEIGKSCNIFSNTVLGSDGFGFAPNGKNYEKIHQLGKLLIGNNVEIGASCCIDRGALENTIIHDGVKLDNLIHIAHNVVIGENSAIAASCAIAGSTKIGNNFRMGGLSGVLGHLSICDDVTVGAHTLITKDINKSGEYIGIMPAQEKKKWAKSSIFIKKREE
ncbi:MAG: UDP-3-O-(3-hydroxymyristoyl)glucosamine N-acyltransferase [Pseudomonadota bacterium]|nr:UDP-3-O-(3-hydroxymyristoyl)glucosamine N-acyltransferase [Pseudomonadota bacterium]